MKKFAKERWRVNPCYSSDNLYALWDAKGNYHRKTDVDTMRARARLMECAPLFLKALQSIVGNTSRETCQEARLVALEALTEFRKPWKPMI